MSKENKELWLFTMRFPYGRSEPFLENELPYLCKRFRKVRIFPMFKDEGLRAIPANASVEELLPDPYVHASLFEMAKNVKVWRKVQVFVKSSAPSKLVWEKQKPELRSRARQGLGRALVLRDRFDKAYDPEAVVLYSYWNYDWALSLGILKLWDPKVNFVTRMLGFDMFKFRAPDGWPAFRTFQLEQASANYVISKAGMEHMLEHYPEYQHQYQLAYLATHDHGTAPWKLSETVRLVSCANMVALKRIDLLINALSQINLPVLWTHFGDGPEREVLEALVAELPQNITVDLKGSTANADILAWYKNNEVDLFIHTSSTEGGVPVAIQEAASFGIPLIGTDVGGIPEIVQEQTGQLVAGNISPSELAEVIIRQHERLQDDPQLRAQVREFWSQHFRAETVYTEFAESLMAH